MKARICCARCLGFTSPSIGEALPLDALERNLGAHGIVDAEFCAVRISEIELGQVTVQMLFAAMLVSASHAATEDREHAFDRVRMHGAANILAAAMVDAFVLLHGHEAIDI